MEVKKKFEKPQMEVVKLKPVGMVCNSCPSECLVDCSDDGAPPSDDEISLIA